MFERDRRGPDFGQDIEPEFDELEELQSKNEYGESSRGWWPGRRSRTLETLLRRAERQTGEAIAPQVRRRLERVLGEDLSSVRVHATDASAAAARALEADAFTVGRDIHFAAGKLDPSSSRGLGLLAHEVAHASMPHIGAGGRGVSDPSEPAERYADQVSSQVIANCSQRAGAIAKPNVSSSARIFRSPPDGQARRESVGEQPEGRAAQDDPMQTTTVMGQQFGGESHYDWGVIDTLLWIEVRIRFTGNTQGLVPTWIDAIHSTWNRFHAVQRSTNQRVWIRFRASTSGTPHRTVSCIQGTGQGANEGEFDTNIAPNLQGGMAAHEFGHMIGLEDEYFRSHGDISRLTGRPTVEGRHPAQTPTAYADHVRNVLFTMTPIQRTPALQTMNNEVSTGRWTDQVAAAYQQRHGSVLFTDIGAQLGEASQEASTMRALFYPSETNSTMSYLCGAGAGCPVQSAAPRHMQRFMRHLSQIRGGTWDPRA